MQSNKKNICIIGGGGFIGTALRTYLSARGYSVFIIGRSVNISLQENEQYYSIAEYSFKQLEALLKDLGFFAIIDLAYSSVPNTSYDDPVKDFSENLYNVIRHLEFAQNVSNGKYIYVSSGGTVYGEQDDALPIKENAPNFPLSPYGVTKLACERYVYMHYRLNNLPALIVRPSNIYGPGQRPFRGQGLAATALGLALRNEPIHIFGDGAHVRDYLYIDDFCAALVLLMEGGTAGEIYNVGYGQGSSILELIECINEVVSKDGFTLKQNVRPSRPFDVHYSVLNIDKMLTKTGWQPKTALGEGIERTWTWIKTHVNDKI